MNRRGSKEASSVAPRECPAAWQAQARRIPRSPSNHHGVHAHAGLTGAEAEAGERLPFDPVEGFTSNAVEGTPKRCGKRRFVRRLIVADVEAVRVAAPHVGIGVIRRHSVANARHHGFGHQTAAGHLVCDLE